MRLVTRRPNTATQPRPSRNAGNRGRQGGGSDRAGRSTALAAAFARDEDASRPLGRPVIDIVLTFILAGIVKGTTGMGLPTVTMGVLGLFMAPAEAAALVIVPELITNVWQFASGPNRLALMARAWPMLLPMALVT